MKLRTPLAIVGVVIGVAAIAGALGYKKYSTIRAGMAAGPPPEFPETVQIVPAAETSFQRTITAVGSLRAVQEVMLATEVAGKVIEVGFESGQRVQEGQTLIQLDCSTEQADLKAAAAAAALAKANVSRMESAPANAVVQMEMDRMRAEALQADARVEQLKTQIDKRVIKAPFSGVIGMRDIHPGQYVDQGRTISTLQSSTDKVHVDFLLPQMQAALLSVGSEVKINLGVVGGQGGLQLPEMTAKVIAIDPRIELETRNARLRAEMPNLGGRLAPGMFVDVRVPLGGPVTVVTAPPTAIRHAPFGDFVFVIAPDPTNPKVERAHQRGVKLGGTAPGGGVIVTEGLAAGERVAADGSFKLREGMMVTAPAAPSGATPAPSSSAAEKNPK